MRRENKKLIIHAILLFWFKLCISINTFWQIKKVTFPKYFGYFFFILLILCRKLLETPSAIGSYAKWSWELFCIETTWTQQIIKRSIPTYERKRQRLLITLRNWINWSIFSILLRIALLGFVRKYILYSKI